MRKKSAYIWGGLLVAASLALTGCGSTDAPADPTTSPETPTESPTEAPETDPTEETEGSDETLAAVTIGVNQLVSHPSLDATLEGFQKAFADAGYVDGDTVTYDVQNAQGDMATATTIASKFKSDSVDLVLAIATPSAQASAQSISDIPILFTAVTEPGEAGLVDSWEAPGGNVTGTSDLNPVADQIALAQEIAPDAETVGIIYSSGEVNSEVQVDLAKEAAEELGLTIKEVTVSASAEVTQAVETLGDVDVIYVPTDNTVVEGLEAVIQFAESKKIPLIVGEGDSVERGGLATYGIDYFDLGYQTGEMAIRILAQDADPATMAVETLDKIGLIVNTGAAERMGVTLSDELVARADKVIE